MCRPINDAQTPLDPLMSNLFLSNDATVRKQTIGRQRVSTEESLSGARLPFLACIEVNEDIFSAHGPFRFYSVSSSLS